MEARTITQAMWENQIGGVEKAIVSFPDPGLLNGWEKIVASGQRTAAKILGKGSLLGIATLTPATLLVDSLTNPKSHFRSFTRKFANSLKDTLKSDKKSIDEKIHMTLLASFLYSTFAIPFLALTTIPDQFSL